MKTQVLKFLPVCMVLALGPAASGQGSGGFDISGTSAAAPSDELIQAVRKKLPAGSSDQVNEAAVQFMSHLRQVAPMSADRLAAGKLDPEDLASRLDVFFEERPDASGQPAATSAVAPRQRVAEALKAFADVARTDDERLALADRFISALPAQSGTASQALASGRMSDDELSARVSVFAGDVRADRSRVAIDPAVAAAGPIVDNFERTNYGNAADRPTSFCFRAEFEQGGTKREFVRFAKAPNKVRTHIVDHGLAMMIFAYDGSTAWREKIGQVPVALKGAEADAVAATSRYYDSFYAYRERGAVARVLAQPENGPLRLGLTEKDGTQIEATIDPKTFELISRRVRRADGGWDEDRFSDYRKIGSLNLAYRQEEYRGGQLHSAILVKSVKVDPGLIDAFFAMPARANFGFMDYMGGMEQIQVALEKQQKKSSAGLNLGGSK